MNSFAKEFIIQSIFRLEENPPRIAKCLKILDEAEVWKKPNAASNSIGNLILHLCGNIRQYIIASLGEIEDSRQRDLEFSAEGGFTKAQLFEKLSTTVNEAALVIRSLNEKQLLKVRSVQGFEFSGIGNIIHVVEHFSYHTGQIAFWTKLLKAKDLGFYADMDLNVKNIVK